MSTINQPGRVVKRCPKCDRGFNLPEPPTGATKRYRCNVKACDGVMVVHGPEPEPDLDWGDAPTPPLPHLPDSPYAVTPKPKPEPKPESKATAWKPKPKPKRDSFGNFPFLNFVVQVSTIIAFGTPIAAVLVGAVIGYYIGGWGPLSLGMVLFVLSLPTMFVYKILAEAIEVFLQIERNTRA